MTVLMTVVSLALLLLTVAVVALFAMMGELVSRVETRGAGAGSPGDDWAMEEPDPEDGREPQRWPPELAAVKEAQLGLVVVLSSSCQSCTHFVAGDLDELRDFSPGYVVSCPSRERGVLFLNSHPQLRDQRMYVDVMGSWAREELHVDISPAAVLLSAGRPIARFTMSSPLALAEKIRISIDSREGTTL